MDQLGLDPAEMANSPTAFFERLHEPDREAILAEMLRPAPGRQWERVVAYCRHEGPLRWLLLQARATPGPDDNYFWCGHMVDVTETHRARLDLERTQQLIEAAQQQAGLGVWDFELATGKITWSPEVFAIHGWTRAEEPNFEEFAGLFPAPDFARLQAAVERAIGEGKPYRLDLEVKRASDGQVRHVTVSGGALRNPATGQIDRLFGTMFDIHDRKMVEQTLATARDAAESAARAKSEFLATMSHEIRTPLNGVIATTSLLRNLYSDGPQREYCETIYRSSEVLLAVVNDILDYSKIESGRLTLEQVPFSLEDLVQGAIEMVSPQLRAKKLALLPELPQTPLPPVTGDPHRLRQVLLNLLSNAIKFTAEGWIRVASEVQPVAGGRCRFRLLVEDSGVGIPSDKLVNLFERFSQAESSSSRRFGGSGLGLAICKQLIERMGGRIGVESRMHQGSTFWIELQLPVHDGTLDKPPAVRPTAGFSRPLHILVAEDNRVNQRIARWVLEGAGHTVALAENGRDAVEAAQGSVDLILMDCQMPEMDGYEATRAIRAILGYRLPIIGLTAHALPEDRSLCLAAGMDDYLAKPYRPEELLERIAQWAPEPVPVSLT